MVLPSSIRGLEGTHRGQVARAGETDDGGHAQATEFEVSDPVVTVAAEELFRFDSPLQLFERWVLVDDYEIAGEHIPKGHKIAMLFGSANRDPRKWEDPDRFDIARGDPTHVTFGWGLHHCIGAPLARLEVASVLGELTTRFPRTHLVSQPVRHQTFVIHGFESVRLSLG